MKISHGIVLGAIWLGAFGVDIALILSKGEFSGHGIVAGAIITVVLAGIGLFTED